MGVVSPSEDLPGRRSRKENEQEPRTMFGVKTIWHCMFSPRLIKLHGSGSVEKMYEPSALENLGDRVLQSLYIMWKIGVYTTPLIVGFLYRRGYFEAEGYVTLTKFVSLLGGIIVVSYVIRGIGRATNPTYRNFTETLLEARRQLTPAAKESLARYDFEFYAWPVEFSSDDLPRDELKDRLFLTPKPIRRTLFERGVSLPFNLIGYMAVHTIGIRLIYPGSLGLVQNLIGQALLQGRAKLVETNAGVRHKLKTKDGNEIDSMFVDRRSDGNGSVGNTLVICCEGNAGFYEIGIMGTPIAAGYSVLGWNHPGFAGSTGAPYPDQELNAMDIVMQFAIHKLGFKVENIVLFGWSIGGYSSTWAAMNYPDVKAVILDASFDDIMPLALNYMPSWSETVVRLAIREYVNLNNFEQLAKYPGPISLIRRTEDEVICTNIGDITTNRGNYLLMKLLKYRYPYIMDGLQQAAVTEYLALSSPSAQEQYVTKYEVNSTWCTNYVENYFMANPKEYPIELGDDLNEEQKTRMALFLARKYMKDYKATHCVTLPSDMFHMPWDVAIENDFVFT